MDHPLETLLPAISRTLQAKKSRAFGCAWANERAWDY